MSHIADLYNNGRCGLHQTLDQARGAYRQLIDKEAKSTEAAHVRQVLTTMKISCPSCGTLVATVRCHVCHYFPIRLPTHDEIEQYECDHLARATSSSASQSTRRSKVTAKETKEKVAQLEDLVSQERREQEQLKKRLADVKKKIEGLGQ